MGARAPATHLKARRSWQRPAASSEQLFATRGGLNPWSVARNTRPGTDRERRDRGRTPEWGLRKSEAGSDERAARERSSRAGACTAGLAAAGAAAGAGSAVPRRNGPCRAALVPSQRPSGKLVPAWHKKWQICQK